MGLGKYLRRPLEAYRGRICACAPGTHASLVEAIRARVPTSGNVLDIGAHAGALLLRLQDAGYARLTGTDLDTTRFDVPGAAFRRLELNRSFAEDFAERFDLITCTDVIEHLDSPRSFVAECRKMLADDGRLALSMPNVAFWEGRIKFLLRGELWGFGARNYRTQRHISPLTADQLRLMLQESGYEVELLTTTGSFATRLRNVLFAPLIGLFRLIGGRHAIGECLIVVARRATPVEDLRRPEHYRKRWAGEADGIGLEALGPNGA